MSILNLDVCRLVRLLNKADPSRRVFGANGHHYELNPALSPSVLDAFEETHGVVLPRDYRFFLTNIGNGGAGPYYGLFKFGEHDDGHGSCTWEAGGLVGDISQPFPHSEPWNLPESFWDEEPRPAPSCPVEEEDALLEAWDRKLEATYWNREVVNGAIPVCHEGCAYRDWLVVSGPQKGIVWRDSRVDYKGLSPLLGTSGEAQSFDAWYSSWLRQVCDSTGVSI